MEGHNRTICHVRRCISQLEGRGIDTFDNDLDDHMNIEDDSQVYDENASYINNKVFSNLQLAIALQQQEFEQQPPLHNTQQSSVTSGSKMITGPQK
ncbi:hypothetical protein Ahy_A10g048507 [Arachis hypogaea]|uniref:Uncharacterized protein n=1 Tax=Arachis hypogaea TaxID=3818 RepID=A0A445B5F6_ARAHY|nr:hypothetical protein Ahy_A10g048507 [Arachis hypogaea]